MVERHDSIIIVAVIIIMRTGVLLGPADSDAVEHLLWYHGHHGSVDFFTMVLSGCGAAQRCDTMMRRHHFSRLSK